LADDFLRFSRFSSVSVCADTAAMPGGDAPSPKSPWGPRSPKKCIPIDLSFSPAKFIGVAPAKFIGVAPAKNIGVAPQEETQAAKHDELVQELGLPAPALFKTASEGRHQAFIFAITYCVSAGLCGLAAASSIRVTKRMAADSYPAKGKNQRGVSPTWPGTT
jgi:hypothetical protein